jgi:hypothetical protein
LRKGVVVSAATVLSQCSKPTVDVTLYTVDGHGAEGACSGWHPVNDLGVGMRCVVEAEDGLWTKEQSGAHPRVGKCG